MVFGAGEFLIWQWDPDRNLKHHQRMLSALKFGPVFLMRKMLWKYKETTV